MRIRIIIDIDYRPYTWESSTKAKEIYNLAIKNCSGIIGNDEEFGILSGSYSLGLNYAKKLSSKCDLVIYKMGEKGSITFANNKTIEWITTLNANYFNIWINIYIISLLHAS